jgi:hypothetical protein
MKYVSVRELQEDDMRLSLQRARVMWPNLVVISYTLTGWPPFAY